MKKKFEIISVNIGVDGNMHDFVESFRCKDESGDQVNIDPFDVDSFPELEDLTQDEQVDWAQTQVGKFLFTEKLVPYKWFASGKTYII